MCCVLRQDTTLTVPPSTQVYNRVPANLMLRVTLWWTSIPSVGEKKYAWSLHATKTRRGSGLMGQIGPYAYLTFLPWFALYWLKMAPAFPLGSKCFSLTLLFSLTQAASVHPLFLATSITKITRRSWFPFWTQSSWAHSVVDLCGAGMPRLTGRLHRYSTTTVTERDPLWPSSSPAATYLVHIPTCPGIAVSIFQYSCNLSPGVIRWRCETRFTKPIPYLWPKSTKFVTWPKIRYLIQGQTLKSKPVQTFLIISSLVHPKVKGNVYMLLVVGWLFQ